jgi:hypothetical protein
MDLIGIQKSIDKINDETLPKLTGVIDQTIPKLVSAINRVVDSADEHIDEDLVQIVSSLNGLALTIVEDLHGILDRVNGITATITIKVPERKP